MVRRKRSFIICDNSYSLITFFFSETHTQRNPQYLFTAQDWLAVVEFTSFSQYDHSVLPQLHTRQKQNQFYMHCKMGCFVLLNSCKFTILILRDLFATSYHHTIKTIPSDRSQPNLSPFCYQQKHIIGKHTIQTASLFVWVSSCNEGVTSRHVDKM